MFVRIPVHLTYYLFDDTDIIIFVIVPGVDHLDPEHYQSVVFAFEDAAGAGSAVEFVEPTQIFVLVKCSILKKERGGKSRSRN